MVEIRFLEDDNMTRATPDSMVDDSPSKASGWRPTGDPTTDLFLSIAVMCCTPAIFVFLLYIIFSTAIIVVTAILVQLVSLFVATFILLPFLAGGAAFAAVVTAVSVNWEKLTRIL
ncbi:hypothetical protein AAVH_09859 [Aphelenchoides avenae]|nr:hypothetical protein AAVH_09859 [Aphelenchus avenae]